MYLFLLGIGFCIAYLVLYFLFPYFFEKRIVPLSSASVRSIALIVGSIVLIFKMSTRLDDLELGNRILHIFGGGYLSFLLCFLVVRDTKLTLDKFQFFVFSFMMVLCLGVANEISEFLLQSFFRFSFAKTSIDTWLDLSSNVFGALLAAACFVPFISRERIE